MHSLGAGGRPARVRFRSRPIKLVIIETPFPDVSGHVFDSKRTSAKWERTDRRTFRITVIDFAIAPGKNGVAVGKIREIAAAVIISPREFALVISFGRVLPFRFGGQTIFSAFARAQPLAKFHGIEITHVNDGMAIPRAGSPLGLVSTIELLVLGVGDQASRDIKAARGNMRKGRSIGGAFFASLSIVKSAGGIKNIISTAGFVKLVERQASNAGFWLDL